MLAPRVIKEVHHRGPAQDPEEGPIQLCSLERPVAGVQLIQAWRRTGSNPLAGLVASTASGSGCGKGLPFPCSHVPLAFFQERKDNWVTLWSSCLHFLCPSQHSTRDACLSIQHCFPRLFPRWPAPWNSLAPRKGQRTGLQQLLVPNMQTDIQQIWYLHPTPRRYLP